MGNSLLRVVRAVVCVLVAGVPAACLAQEAESGDSAELYRASVQERQAEVKALQDQAGHIDDAIRSLRSALTTENRYGRNKDLEAWINQLTDLRTTLDETINAEQNVLSHAETQPPEEVFYEVAAKDLAEQQQERRSDVESLDRRLHILQGQLERRIGTSIRRRNISRQIEEVSRWRDRLAASPEVDVTDENAVQAEVAREFSAQDVRRQMELLRLRTRIAQLEARLAAEGRRVRRESLNKQIGELSSEEYELDVRPLTAPERMQTARKPSQIIERGLEMRQMQQSRQAEVLDRRVARLRQRLQAEGRRVRRASILLQIQELERQKQSIGKPQSEFEAPPTRGFRSAPYGSPLDIDYEYTRPAETD